MDALKAYIQSKKIHPATGAGWSYAVFALGFLLVLATPLIRILQGNLLPYENWPGLLVILPLAAVLILTIFGRILNRRLVQLVSLAASFFSALLAFVLSAIVRFMPDAQILKTYYTWANVGELQVDIALAFDPLTAVFALTIAVLGLALCIFCIAFIKEDSRLTPALAYLLFFQTAAMTAVLAASLPLLFTGLALLSIAAYLMTGMLKSGRELRRSSLYVLFPNLTGDMLFLCGALMIMAQLGNMPFGELSGWATSVPVGWLVSGSVLMVLGLSAKAAMLPFGIFLPRTSMSISPATAALASTGSLPVAVYALLRLNLIVIHAEPAMLLAAVLGVFSAFAAAMIAANQRDVTKVLSWAAVSQSGLAVAGFGFGAFSSAALQVLTFSAAIACLIMTVGAFSKAAGGERDIYRLGNRGIGTHRLRFALLAGCLFWAVSLPLGLYSVRSAILTAGLTLHPGLPDVIAWLLSLLLIVALLVNSYAAARLYYALSAPLAKDDQPPLKPIRKGVLVAVALPALLCLAGLFSSMSTGTIKGVFATYLSGALNDPPKLEAFSTYAAVCLVLTLAVSVMGWLLAYKRYGKIRHHALPRPESSDLEQLFEKELLLDKALSTAFIKPPVEFGRLLGNVADNWITESLFVRSAAWLTRSAGLGLRFLQSGNAQTYLLYILCGLVLLLACLWRGWLV